MRGLKYQHFDFHNSRCHLLRVDLTRYEVRPVLAADAFPFRRIYPIREAIAQGALAAVGSGFNLQTGHGRGITDQPLHALVVDREIYTNGIGAGGYGLLIGEGQAWVQQNRIQIRVWRPDHTPLEVDSVNLDHEGVVAFTPRGGTNIGPKACKFQALLTPAGEWAEQEGAQMRRFLVQIVSVEPIQVLPESIVLESQGDLRIHSGDVVTWTQRLGAPGVRHVVSGIPGIVRDGKNVTDQLNLDPTAPDGPDGWFVRENPRVVLGVSEDHKALFMVTVEGRVPGSEGLRFQEMANMLVDKGVHDATNMDGGGSAWQWQKEWPKNEGLVADSCYGTGTLAGLRPDHYVVAVF